MSLIDRTGNPFTAPLRRRLLAGAMAAAALTGLSAHSVFAQDIVVSGGAVQSNSSPATYNSIDVSGTDGSGNPSTYNADAPLTLTGSLNAHDRGVFNANARVSLVSASAQSNGVINLNTGTLSASQGLSFDGVGSVTRSAGNYLTNSLTLRNGASLGYDAGDMITGNGPPRSVSLASGATLTLAKDLNLSGGITVDGAATSLVSAGQAISAGSLSVDSGATVTLDQNLTLSGDFYLRNGGSITRTSETISALFFNVDNATLDLLASDTFIGPGSLNHVENGAIVNAPAGWSIGYLSASGTNENGDRATFNVNGDVSLVNAAASSNGVINLTSGTLSASQGLSFDGVGSVARSAGSYSTNELTLSNGATLSYDAGDSITNTVSLVSGAALTLNQNLTLSNYLDLPSYLGLTNGGSITRTSETISAPGFIVDNATLDLLASDTFNINSGSYVQNGGLVNAPAGTSIGYLSVSGTNGNGDRATFNVNGNATFNGAAQAYSNGVINLNAGTLSASMGLSFDGVGSVARSAGSYYTEGLTLSNGVTLGYDAEDTITSSVSLASGATLTLAKDLNVSGGITVDGAATSLISTGQAISANSLSVNNGATVTLDQNLTLAGYLSLQNGGAIARNSETISALAFDVDNATFDLLAGDTFSPGSLSYVLDGAIVNAPAGTSIGYLSVSGTNGNGDRATFNANGSITLTSADVYSDGVINLIAGTLSTPSLSLSGVGSAGQSGGNYDVTNLFLDGGATVAFGLGDSIDSLSVAGAGSLLNELAPLTLSSLSLTNGGVLYLGAFTGTGTISNWGLRITGDDTVFLQALIELGLLTAGLSPLSVIFDAGSNMTYVTLVSGAVPEIDPTTAHGAVVLLVGALGLLERRLRQAAIARHAA